MKKIYFFKKIWLLTFAIFLGLQLNVNGQSMVIDINPNGDSYPADFFEYNSQAYFFAMGSFYMTDGTTEGTVLIKEVDFEGYKEVPVVINNKIYFNGSDANDEDQLFISDGTADGTVLLKEIYPIGNSGAVFFTKVNGKVVFRAQDGGADGETNGNKELWVTDGTTDGTSMLKDINPGDVGSELSDFIAFGDSVLFAANDSVIGKELWITDGTADGTVVFKDINIGEEGSDPEFFTYVGNTLYFKASDELHGQELWTTDGTPEGTVLVKDISPGDGNSGAAFFTDLNGTLFFKATDGINGKELWKSDGTADGTVMIKDIYVGSEGGGLQEIIAVGDYVFLSVENLTDGTELWKSDGTEAGTVMVKDINTTSGEGSHPYNLHNINGKLFFVASDGVNGYELWRSDGTEAGTVMVKDINPVGGTSIEEKGAVVDNIFYFAADDNVNGEELWSAKVLNITSQPAAVTNANIDDAELVLSVTADGEGVLTYQWQKDGVDLDGETGAALTLTSLVAEDAGEYTCIVSDEFYGDLTSETAVVNVSPTSIQELNKESLTIYPNPSNGMFTIEGMNITKEASISVFDIKGQLVYQATSISSKFDLDISDKAKGVYILKTMVNQKAVYSRLVLK